RRAPSPPPDAASPAAAAGDAPPAGRHARTRSRARAAVRRPAAAAPVQTLAPDQLGVAAGTAAVLAAYSRRGRVARPVAAPAADLDLERVAGRDGHRRLRPPAETADAGRARGLA